MRLLILGSPGDPVVRDVVSRAAARRMAETVQVRTLHDLARARWRHRSGVAGVVTEATFADGATLDALAPTAVLNRLRDPPAGLFPRLSPADRDYAAAEFGALLLSWLASLGVAVTNRPDPSCLAGPALHPWTWAARASAVGLLPFPGAATTSIRLMPPAAGNVPRPELLPAAADPALAMGRSRPGTSAPPRSLCRRVLVVGREAFANSGAIPPESVASCVALAAAAGVAVLEVRLACVAGDPRWRFVGADPFPGTLAEAETDALLRLMAGRA